MLLSISLTVVLLSNRVLAKVCSETFTSAQTLERHGDPTSSQTRCEYFIEAPKNDIINITLSELYGFSHASESADCLPRLDFTEIMESGRERTIQKLCGKANVAAVSQVIVTDTRLVKLTFNWSRGRASGFTLNFSFHHQKAPCEFRCVDGECLPEASLVCNAVADCYDASDEEGCPASGSSSDNASLIEIVIIIIVVAIIMGVGVCFVTQYRLAARLSDYRARRDSATDSNHLNPASPQASNSEVVYVPSSPGHRERLNNEIRMQAVDAEGTANLPPRILRSRDGEEGYSHSQRNLHLATQHAGDNVFTPPPNRTIGPSPAPHRQRSQSAVPGYARSAGKGANRDTTLAASSALPRCHTHSSNNNSKSRQWTPSPLSPPPLPAYSPPGMGLSPNGVRGRYGDDSGCSDGPPPDYSEVVATMDGITHRQLNSNV